MRKERSTLNCIFVVVFWMMEDCGAFGGLMVCGVWVVDGGLVVVVVGS